MNNTKKVTFEEDIIDYTNNINSSNKSIIKENLIESFKNIDIDETLYKNIFNQIDAYQNFHNNHIDEVDSDDEYFNNTLKKEKDLDYESSEDENYNDNDNYDNLECLEIDDIDKKSKYVLGFREYIFTTNISNDKSNNNEVIYDKSNNNEVIDDKSNNEQIIEDKSDNILDDILDKIDLDDNKLDILINDLVKEEYKEEKEDNDKEVIVDQKKKNSFDIEISYNTFKKRYSELCDKKKEPIILKLFKILITNNPNKNLEFYVNFVKSFISNDK